MAAGRDDDQAQPFDRVAGRELVLAVVGQLRQRALAGASAHCRSPRRGASASGSRRARSCLERDQPGGERVVGDDRGLGRDPDIQAGVRQRLAIERAHDRRRIADQRHALAERLFAADDQRDAARLGRHRRRTARRSRHNDRDGRGSAPRRRCSFGSMPSIARLLASTSRRIAEVHHHPARLPGAVRRARSERPNSRHQRRAATCAARLARRCPRADLHARQVEVGEERPESRGVGNDLEP